MFPILLESLLGRTGDKSDTLKKICTVTPPTGIKIHGVYFLLGRYDGEILFEGSNLRTAKVFTLRAATHLYTSETLMALPTEKLEPAKEA